MLVHEHSGARAAVQVKSGRVGTYRPLVAEEFDRFFVVLAKDGDQLVGEDERLTLIPREEIEAFAIRNWNLLPRRLQRLWKPHTAVAPS